MTQITSLPVGSSPPNDWWRRVATAVNALIGAALRKDANLSDLADPDASRGNLGLGTLATQNATSAHVDALTFTTLPGNYANDAAAAAGGVPVGGIYRNSSTLMIRIV